MGTTLERARAFFEKYRRRLATLVLFVFLAIVAIEVVGVVPRDMRIAVPIGAGHENITEARIDYWHEQENVHSVTMHWDDGAPRILRHDLSLTPGEYEVSVRLRESDGDERRLTGHVVSPADGVVQLSLEGS
jgi:hypothetical protein